MSGPTLLAARNCDFSCKTYHKTPLVEADGSDSESSVSDVEVGAMRELILELEGRIRVQRCREVQAQQRLEDFDCRWKSMREPPERELSEAKERLRALEQELKQAKTPAKEPPPGPASMSWVDSKAFDLVCGAVVTLNLLAILVKKAGGGEGEAPPSSLDSLDDHLFLAWYIFELAVKLSYHRRNLLVGSFCEVWPNWLDLGIVVCGVVFQWLLPLFVFSGTQGSSSMLGLLRLCRLMRIFKLLKLLYQGDLSWTEGAEFQMFMTIVIAFNAILMSLELDHAWTGWDWAENALLCIYLFELTAKMKHQGCTFFYSSETLAWNYLDMCIVFGAVLDLWTFPFIKFMSSLVGSNSSELGGPHLREVMSLLRLMRLMRILRLVKLMKAIKPLYRLLSGVLDSLRAMQWVMVLCLLMLYAAAIFWTTVVGKGLLYDQDNVPTSVVSAFGTVPRSFFSLFRMMNGDSDVAVDVFPTIGGQVFFVLFMVTASWAILAILTSVVSDNMISASTKLDEEEKSQAKQAQALTQERRLRNVFEEFDLEGDGIISEPEWRAITEHPGYCQELLDASGSSREELEDAFRDLSIRRTRTRTKSGNLKTAAPTSGLMMPYARFIQYVQDRDKPADGQHVLKLLSRLEHLEGEIWRAQRSACDPP